jgi:uncharacterized protein (TIGR00299 family) protein
MRIAFLDCFAGVAGDMWVAALLDAGLPLGPLERLVDSLGLQGVRIAAEPTRRAGIAATRFWVEAGGGQAPVHRGLAEILGILGRAAVPVPVRERAEAVFAALAEVEARAHGVPVESVHFHELGAVDTIVDVLCACLGLHELGIERVYASAVEVGSGTLRCEHGILPVPAPGTLGNLLGVPIVRGGLRGERTTPTGAALLRVLCDGYEPRLRWIPDRVGHGAGTRDDRDFPNVLRVTLGRVDAERSAPGSLLEISCNLDTCDGETVGWLIEAALERGALDAFCLPAVGKKGRPVHLFQALVEDAGRDEVVRLLLEESSSLGLRIARAERTVLERWGETLSTAAFGAVRYKCVRLPSGAVLRRPEDGEVRRIAAEHRLGRREVLGRLAADSGR